MTWFSFPWFYDALDSQILRKADESEKKFVFYPPMKVKQVNYNFTVLLNYHLDGEGAYNGVHKWWDGTKKQVIFWVIKLSLTFIPDIWQGSSTILLMDYEKIEFTNGLWKNWVY